MRVYVKGTWLCMKHELQQMLAQGGGTIANTASVAGLVGAALQSVYAGTKHAVVELTTNSAAAEYARKDIRGQRSGQWGAGLGRGLPRY